MAARDYSDYNAQRFEEGRVGEGSLAPFTFLCVVLVLVASGLLMLYSSSYAEALSHGLPHYYYVLRQGIFALLGIAVAAVVNFVPVKWIRLASIPLLSLAVIAMVLTLLTPYGVTVMGARRWLDLPLLPQFQPSELLKLSLVIFLAWWFSSAKTRRYPGWYHVVPFIIAILCALLIVAQRAYTTAVHFLLIFFALCIAAGLKLRYLITAGAFAAVPAVLMMLSEPYRVRRVASFIYPSLDPQGMNWQVNMSLSAIAEGGLFGKGIGNGTYKLGLLPEVQNDFILASIIEETGIAGFLFISMLFILFAVLGLRAAVRLLGRDDFQGLLCVGITIMIVSQVVLNIAVVTGLLPPTGIPLPFFSQGGTNLFIILFECGLLYRTVSASSKEVAS